MQKIVDNSYLDTLIYVFMLSQLTLEKKKKKMPKEIKLEACIVEEVEVFKHLERNF